MITFTIQTKLGALKLDAQASMNAEIMVLSGHNGAGKTTLLRCLAGLEMCQGLIQENDHIWLDSAARFTLPTAARNVGFVWAESVLLPWLNIEDNITLGATENISWLDEICAAFEVDDLRKRQPSMLSTGEAQRVALARACYQKPTVLLLDEPFSAQAPDIRKRLRIALKAMQKKLNVPMLIVSHDNDDAKALADKHWYMREGKLMVSINRHSHAGGNLKEQKVNHE